MLMPRKVKHRKQHRGRMTGHGQGRHHGRPSATTASRRWSPGWITARQIEAARIAMTRHVKRGGKVWISIFPDKPVTEKPAETRMGSGKGNPEHWVAVVKPGRVMFELAGVRERPSPARRMERAIQKLPIKAKFVTRAEEASDGDDRSRAARPRRRGAARRAWPRRSRSCSTCASSSSPASSTTTPGSACVQARHRPHRDAAARAGDPRPPRPQRPGGGVAGSVTPHETTTRRRSREPTDG